MLENHTGLVLSGVTITLMDRFAVSGTVTVGTMNGVSGAMICAGNINPLGREVFYEETYHRRVVLIVHGRVFFRYV